MTTPPPFPKRLRLNQELAESLPGHPNKQRFYWDAGGPRGFGLRIAPGGQRSFILQYRVGERERRQTIGRVAEITVEQARAQAEIERGLIAQHRDPVAERKARQREARERENRSLTVKALGVKFLARVDRFKKPRTSEEYRRTWRLHVLPRLGSRLASEVTFADVAELHEAISAKGKRIAANRAVTVLRLFFKFSIRRGVIASGINPAVGHELNPENKRGRLLSPQEYARIGAALTKAEREGLPPYPLPKKKPRQQHTSNAGPHPMNPYIIGAIRFLILSGARLREVLGLRWDEVNLETGRAQLTDTKTGASSRPLGPPALDVLRSLPREPGNPHCFPGARRGSHLVNVAKSWRAIRHAAGMGDLRIHDLRHGYASVGSPMFDLRVVGSVLGHKSIQSTERYSHLSDHPGQVAADTIASAIHSMLEGRETPVTPLRAVR